MALPNQRTVLTASLPWPGNGPNTISWKGDGYILEPAEFTRDGPLLAPDGTPSGAWSWRFPEHIPEDQKIIVAGLPSWTCRDWLFSFFMHFKIRPVHILCLWEAVSPPERLR